MNAFRRACADALADLRAATGSDGLRDPVMAWTVWPAACPVCGGALIAAADLLPTCTFGNGCRRGAILYRLRAHADELAESHVLFSPEDVLDTARELHCLAGAHEPHLPWPDWEDLAPLDRWRRFIAARDAINALELAAGPVAP